MTNFDEADVVRHLERLATIQPSPEAGRRAVARTRAALSRPVAFRRRTFPVAKVAAALLLTACLAGLAWLTWSGTGSAFADVQDKVRQTRTLSCTITLHEPGKPPHTDTVRMRGPELLRSESADGHVAIIDYRVKRCLFLDPLKKEARIVKGLALPAPNVYDKLRQAHKDPLRKLGEKEIAGKQARGYRMRFGDGTHSEEGDVWVDARTRLPVRIEISSKDDAGRETRQVIDELVFDGPVDETLFQFTVPAGYREVTVGTDTLPPTPTKKDEQSPEVIPLAGIGPARFGMSRDEAVKALGQPDDIPKEGRGTQLNYFSRGFSLTVSPTRGLLAVTCVSQKTFLTKVRDFRGKTKEGVGIGSDLKDVEAAFGSPDSKETNGPETMYVRYTQLKMDFTLFSGKVVQIMFRGP